MNSRFCSKTRQQMFLFVSVRHVGAHQGAPAWRLRTISELFLWSESWRGSLKCTSFHFPDSGLYLLNGFDFYFDLFWMAWHRRPPIIAGLLGMVFAPLWQFLTETAVHSPYFVLSPYFLYPVRSPQSLWLTGETEPWNSLVVARFWFLGYLVRLLTDVPSPAEKIGRRGFFLREEGRLYRSVHRLGSLYWWKLASLAVDLLANQTFLLFMCMVLCCRQARNKTRSSP